jgi:transketolase
MRIEFASAIVDIAKRNERIAFLSGDLGFMALEEVQETLKDRFINCGVAEQNMMSVAAGLAARGFIPITYSIAPFATMRPFEQIRNDICLHNLPVKIVGNGGGYGYGIMGATHHALEDVAVMRSLPNMSVYVPCFGSDVAKGVQHMLEHPGPAYLRLGKSVADYGEVSSSGRWSNFRRITPGNSVVVIAMGPVIENVIQWMPDLPPESVELWSVGSFPVRELPDDFRESVKRVKKVITIEEHYRSGGLGESLGTFLANLSADKLTCINLCAEGYPSGLYGSQRWHQEESGLAGTKLYETIIGAVNR